MGLSSLVERVLSAWATQVLLTAQYQELATRIRPSRESLINLVFNVSQKLPALILTFVRSGDVGEQKILPEIMYQCCEFENFT